MPTFSPDSKERDPQEGFQHNNTGIYLKGRLGSRSEQQVTKDTLGGEGKNMGRNYDQL
jgi:hypothetical protein